MAIDVTVAAEVMQRKIDRLADIREQPSQWGDRGLGGGFYSVETRSLAAMMAADWLAVAEQYDVTLDDLNAVTDLASGALDAVQAARRRLSR